MKIKKGDQIIVTTGKDKGRKGKVDAVDPQANTVTVPGVNIYKRHQKKKDEQHQGGIIEFTRPLSMGKVALMCPKCGKQTRVGYIVTKGEKERMCKKCEQRI
ncbi:50S ribosomal protein L24 [Candidatus Gottesmanbacteria bacterium RIFCSPLOWO2_01_FULL_46_9]|uniref:Large ribosomal subunit protein uL24 n=1 Tax=Candidatus Gottesmanbacteria bacterium RIFCSPLOWO2_01_FULL_46_9 TaxID=1798394 RepID=A0A1F6B3G9_9BACT|nr:MAG: 50S ribosomal protein L24 [Candidatus Gottesmanbacteria bacterium RIFCSPLOWO2_01_FULL_46_9]